MADTLYSRLGEVAVKVESTKGTKNLPAVDGTESKLLVYDIRFTPGVAKGDRRPASRHLSRFSHTMGTQSGTLAFSMDLRKTAVTNTEDFWGRLMGALGHAFATGVYTPTTTKSAHTTLTMLAWLGTNGTSAVRVGLRGAMGNARLVCNVGERSRFEFEFMGVHATADSDLKPVDDPLNAVTHEDAVAAAFQGVSLTYGGTATVVPSFTLDFGNVLQPREDVSTAGGILHYDLVDRVPTVTMGPDFGLVAAKDYLGIHNLGTEAAIAWSLTQPATTSPSVNARTIAFAAPAAQMTEATLGDRNGIQTAELTFGLNRSSSGDDEYSLTLTGS